MKKVLRVDFRYFWSNFNKKNNLILEILEKKYSVVIDSENPDLVFFSVFGEYSERSAKASSKFKKFFPSVHTFLKKSIFWRLFKESKLGKAHYQNRIPEIKGNFKKIFITQENIFPEFDKCDFAFGVHEESIIKNKNYLRLPVYLWYTEKKDLLAHKKYAGKKKFCNFLYSNEEITRNKFFKLLSKYKKIDSPGQCMNNAPPLGESKCPLDSRNKIDWDAEKIKFLKDYKFTIAFENSVSPGYSTEKVTQPMVAGSIPIYFGDPNIGKRFNTKSFLTLKSKKTKDMKKLIEKIIEIDNDEEKYKKIFFEKWASKKKLDSQFNYRKYLNALEGVIEG